MAQDGAWAPSFLKGTLTQVIPAVVRGRTAGRSTLPNRCLWSFLSAGGAISKPGGLGEGQGVVRATSSSGGPGGGGWGAQAHGLLPRNAVLCGGRTAVRCPFLALGQALPESPASQLGASAPFVSERITRAQSAHLMRGPPYRQPGPARSLPPKLVSLLLLRRPLLGGGAKLPRGLAGVRGGGPGAGGGISLRSALAAAPGFPGKDWGGGAVWCVSFSS